MKQYTFLMFAYCLLVTLVSCDDVERIYYPNGQVHIEEPRLDGKIHGLRTVYYSDGKIDWQANFVNDKQNGIYRKYYPSGQLMNQDFFKDDIQNGIMIEYYEDGTKKSIQNYQNGVSEGVFLFYYPSGTLEGYAILRKDSTIFNHSYNEKGELTNDFHFVDILPLQGDTIHEGDTYKAKIKLHGPLKQEYKEVYMYGYVEDKEKYVGKYWKVKTMEGEILYENNTLKAGNYILEGSGYGFREVFKNEPGGEQAIVFQNARTIVVLPK